MKKKILILGGSSDIGFNTINKLLLSDCSITAHYFSNKGHLQKINNKNLELVKLDFSKMNEKNTKKIINRLFNKKYDTLINLVGYVDNKSFMRTDLKSILKSIKINAIIPFLIQQKIVPGMLLRNYGRILNCSSIGVKFGGGMNSYNYGLSKHCLEFIPNSFKIWAKKNVMINNLRIGVTDTKIHLKMKKNLKMKSRLKLIPINRMAKTNEISNYISKMVAEENSYMTGQTVTVSGGE